MIKPNITINVDTKNVYDDMRKGVKSAKDTPKVSKDKVVPTTWSNHGLFVNQLTLGDVYFDNFSFNFAIIFISNPFETERIIPPSSGKRKSPLFLRVVVLHYNTE